MTFSLGSYVRQGIEMDGGDLTHFEDIFSYERESICPFVIAVTGDINIDQLDESERDEATPFADPEGWVRMVERYEHPYHGEQNLRLKSRTFVPQEVNSGAAWWLSFQNAKSR